MSEVAPDATRAECKLLLRSARDMQLERDDLQGTAESESDLSAPVAETAHEVIFGCPRVNPGKGYEFGANKTCVPCSRTQVGTDDKR